MDNETVTADPVAVFDGESLTVRETADELRKGITAVRRLIDRGAFPHVFKDGPYTSSPWRVPRADIDAYKRRVVARQPRGDGENNEPVE